MRQIKPRFRFPAFLAVLAFASVTSLGQKTNQYDPGTPPQHTTGVSQLGTIPQRI